MNDENDKDNPFGNFDPYDCLMELTRQQKEMAAHIQMIVSNQHALAHALNEQQSHIEKLGLVIRQLQAHTYNFQNGKTND
jgi:hypothetical protein